MPESYSLLSVSKTSRRRILSFACWFSVALVIVGGVITWTAEAANYNGTAVGAVNWTSIAWGCSTVDPSEVCPSYPGQFPTAFGNNATIGGTGTAFFNSTIPNAFTLNTQNAIALTVDVQTGGAINLTGASFITGTSGTAALDISGGSVTNDGTLTVTSGTPVFPQSLNLNSGSLGGTGTTSIGANGRLNVTATSGAMNLNQNLANGNVANFNSPGTLTVGPGVTFLNAATGTFNANGGGTIASGGAGNLFSNAGTFTKNAGTPFTVNIPFSNTGTVSEPSSLMTLNLAGGSGPGGHGTGTWSLALSTLNFGGTHVFNNTQTFAGIGTVGIDPLGQWTLNTAGTMTLPAGLNLTNSGVLELSSSATLHTLSLGGPYTQTPSGELKAKIGPPTGVSDALIVGGTATLAGKFTALLGVGYTPTIGDLFSVLSANPRSGDFTTKNLPPFAGGQFTTAYTATSPTVLQLLAVGTVDISLLKTGPASVLHNAVVNYTVKVGNLSTVTTANNIVVTDTFSSGTFNAGATSPGCILSGPGTVTCTIASLGPLTSVNLNVAINATAVGSIVDTATLLSVTETDTNSANNSASFTTTVVAVADLSIVKGDAPDPVNAGGNLTYTLDVTNAGPDASGPITVTDFLPAGTTFVSFAGTNWACLGTTTVTCTAPLVLASASSPTLTINVTAPPTGGSITNNALVTSTTADPTLPNTASAITTVLSADLAITKVSASPLVAGQNTSYTITVTNNGPSPAAAVSVVDAPGASLTFVSNTGACTTSFPCSLGALAPLGTATITSTFLVDPTATGTVTNTATVSSPTTPDPNTPNNSATASGTVGVNADVSITKTGPASALPNQNITFNISLLNNGPSAATGVVVNDLTPAGLIFVSNSGSCATPFPCTIGGLAVAGTASIDSVWTVAPAASGSITNTAAVTTTSTDPTPGNNSASATFTVTPSSDVSISKTGPVSASPGQTVVYSITVTNNGPDPATGVIVSDPTPAQLAFVSNGGACGTAYPCTLGSMSSGSSLTILSTFTVSTTATGSVTNTASVTSTTLDPVPSNNTGSKTTTIVPAGDLQITKSGPANIPTSGSIVFTILVMNNSSFAVSGVTVNDSPSLNMAFASNAGACTTPFPCTFASLAAGASTTITSTFNLLGNPSTVTNTASVSSASISDTNPANNTASVTVTAGSSCLSGAPTIFIPFDGESDVPADGTMQWTSVGATSYDVYFGPAGTGCKTLVGTANGTKFTYSGLSANASYEAKVVANKAGCQSQSSPCIHFSTGKTGGCTLGVPQLQKPANGSQAGSLVTLQWSDVGADSYHVVVTVDGVNVVDTTTTNTTLDVTIPSGTATWKVTAISGNCTTVSATGTFNVCAPPAAPHAGVVGAPTTGNIYSVIVVDPAPGTTQYEFQEANNEAFTGAQTQTTPSASVAYQHAVTGNALVFFYRVRAFTACTTTAGAYSRTIRVVILPNRVNLRRPTVNVPAGSRDLVVQQVFIPGETAPVNFSATSDRPWIVKIEPASGILPPEGITLNVTLDPAQLPNGTFTATVIVTTSSLTTLNGRPIETHAGTSKSSPVTINLVTPVVPVDPSKPTTNSVFIPAVGHLAGLNSQWRSDVRIYNPTPVSLKYLLTFVPNGVPDAVKSTTVETAAGETTALDDIIHNWFGFGEVGDSATGVLEVRPIAPSSGTPQFSLVPVVSSRTFNASGDGTVGQFIPGVPFTKFIGNGLRQSMQQVAQSAAYRTNFAVVEGSGSPASVVLSMFNSGGNKLFDLPVNLAPGEQKLLNGLLAEQGVSLTDGRMEVRVSGGDGKVTAYASVIDNASLDPQFVPGATLGATSKLYVVPGVADLNGGGANWRTDMRIYNAGSASQTAELAFYPQDNGLPFFATLQIEPNQVKVVDNVLQSLFATHDTGGAVQITTASDTELVVTGRTFNQTSEGTLGQFIRGVTAADGITQTGKALNILQVEDSVRFRTNVGVSEMTGKPATVEISLNLPDSKVTPTIEVPLAANEFRQFSVSQFGLGNVYNARLSVKVVGGDGTVTAYGSVIDQITTDPTFVAAQ
jgi:uncharacterized repeat protein (TIGR01451 family)